MHLRSARPAFLVAAVLVGIVGVAPLLAVVVRALRHPDVLTSMLSASIVWEAAWGTLRLAVVTTVVAVGIGAPLAWLTTRTDLPARGLWRSLLTIPYVVPPYIAAVACDGVLNYSTVKYLENRLLAHLSRRAELKHVLIVAHGVNHLDEDAAAWLGCLVQRLRGEGRGVSFSGVKDNILDALENAGVLRIIGEAHLYTTQALALDAIHEEIHQGSAEDPCPLRTVVYADGRVPERPADRTK